MFTGNENRSLAKSSGLSVLITMLVSISAMAGEPGTAASGETVFELRTYTTHEGRLPALQARFRDHTMGLFEKHGMRNIGYWIPADRPNTLIYIIAHADADAVSSNWKAFASDPAWQAVARESRKDGPILIEGGITNQFMTATDYSPLK